MYTLSRSQHLSLLVKIGITSLFLLCLTLIYAEYSSATDSSTISLSSNQSTTIFGESVTFQARIIDTVNIPPTGTLTFMSGDQVIGEQPLVTNSGSISTVSMSSDSGYTIPTNWKNSCTTCPVMVWGDYVYWVYDDINNNSIYNIVAYDSNKAIVKQVTVSGGRYIASITDNLDQTITLTGQSSSVIVNLSTLAIAGAEFTTDSLAVGTDSVTAEYSGDGNHTSSVSNAVSQVVNSVSYTVSFNSNGGTAIASQSVSSNGTATSPADPTKIDYTFAGWYSDAGLTTPYTFNQAITADITLYAKWTANSETVGLDGSEPNLAVNSDRIGYPSISASFTCCVNQDNPWYAIDGIFSTSRWTNYGGHGTDWLAIDFGSTTTFNKVNLYLYNDGGGVQPPASYNVQYWDGAAWVDASNQVKSPLIPTGSVYSTATPENTLNTVSFDTVVTDQVRVVFTNGSNYVGIVELEVYYEDLIPSGEGTDASPYAISNEDHLKFMGDHLSSHYVLSNDIHLSDAWTPIGTNLNPFQGSLDGQGYSITGLSINAADSDYLGLFGEIGSTGVVKNLTIDGAVLDGNNYVGVLAGSSQGNIDNVTITNANVSAQDNVGVLIGKQEQGSIQDSHTNGVVSGIHSVGGLVGDSSGFITGSSAAVTVTGTGYYIAGLVGYLQSNGSIANSYASGNVTGPSNTGGLVGQNAASTITNSFALGNISSGGALVGYNFNGTIIDSYASGLVGDSGLLLGGTSGGTVTNSSWKNYIVYYDSNGGTTVSIQGLTIGEQVTAPTQPTKSGYTFDGWYSDAGLSTPYSFGNIISAFTPLYAQWTINSYTVTFDSNGGEVEASPTTKTASYSSSLGSLPAAPTRTGYTFTGWNTAADGSGTAFDATTVVTGSINVFAQWTINSYTVIFDSNDGSEVANQAVVYNLLATAPAAPTKTGYTFDGWYADEALTEPYIFSTAVIGDITLHARWLINSYKVTFDSNGGSTVATQNVIYNLLASEPTAPTETGYTFDGWYSDAALNNAYSFTSLITGDTTLYAKWTINEYTVSFNSDGGSEVDNQNVDYNLLASEPTVPTKTGYTFLGWYSDAELSNQYSFATQVTESITLYAKWESYMEAEDLVSIAEIYQTQISVNEAYEKVNELNNSSKKAELLNRIAAVQAIIDSTTIGIDDIVKLITEGTFQQKDINQDGIFDSDDVEIMLQRISTMTIGN